ncbi:hypothetical protein GA0115255_118211, partial [Streptomyces sp. Ncost-T6T-2b]
MAAAAPSRVKGPVSVRRVAPPPTTEVGCAVAVEVADGQAAPEAVVLLAGQQDRPAGPGRRARPTRTVAP